MSIQSFSAGTFVPVLRMLSTILDKGAEHAKAKGIEPNSLLEARLAPDMLPLTFQIKFSCDQARDAISRLTGQPLVPIPDDEKTLADYKARIEKSIAYVLSAKPDAFKGAEDREVEVPLMGDMVYAAKGSDFLREWTLPNFFFHVTTAYDILRHNGVQLGKPDFMGYIGPHMRPKAKA